MAAADPTECAVAAPERLAALHRTALLDSPAEEAFDRLTRLATRILHVPVALVSLVDADRQYFKSCVGLPTPWQERRETPLSMSYCQHLLTLSVPLVIPDAREHPLVRDNPALQELGAVAYAGIPLRTVDRQHVLGSFCVIDHQPRAWTPDEVAILEDLAALVMTELDLRATRSAELEARSDAARRREAESARERLALLSDVSALLSSPPDVEAALDDVAAHAVPVLADLCVVCLQRDEARVPAAGLAHRDADSAQDVRAILQHYPDALAGPALARGEAEYWSQRAPGAPASGLTGDRHALLERLGVRSMVSLPLRMHGPAFGVLSLARFDDTRSWTAGDEALARELAHRLAVALENARLLAEVRAAVEARDTFLSIAAHELRTPLTPLVLQLQTLSRDLASAGVAADAKARRAVGKAMDQVRRLTALVELLLDVSRLARGRLELHPEEDVDLTALVREVVEQMREPAARAGCTLALDAARPVRGRWDPVRVQQVLLGLLNNAFKYGSGQPVEVAVTSTGSGADGVARITVRDHGIGVDVADARRIFGRFERAVSSRNYGGLGLGLFVARELVEAHHGALLLQSRPGQGAAFTVVLPLQPDLDKPTPAAGPAPTPAAAGSGAAAPPG